MSNPLRKKFKELVPGSYVVDGFVVKERDEWINELLAAVCEEEGHKINYRTEVPDGGGFFDVVYCERCYEYRPYGNKWEEEAGHE